MNAKIKQIPTIKNYEYNKKIIDAELDKALKVRKAKDEVNRWLHIFEIVVILGLIAAVTVEGFFIYKLSQKEPSTALIVTEADLLNLPVVPKEQLKEQ